MKIKVPVMLLISSLLFTLSGCQGGQDNSEVGTPQKSVTGTDASTLMVDEVFKPHTVDMKSQVKRAIMDLAGRLNIPPNEIKVVRAESVTWRDGSRGCPKKGMSYTQALVPGALIVLRAGDAEYEYHSGSGGDPFYCADYQLPASVKKTE